MEQRLSDEELLKELKDRFEQNVRALREQERLMNKLKDVNKKLEDSEALKSHFLSNIKNEINNPLASTLGLSKNLINNQNMTRERISSTAALVHSEIFSLNFQLNNIFSAAEIEAGESHPQLTKTDVVTVVRDVIDAYLFKTQKKNVFVDFSTHGHNENEEIVFVTDSNKIGVIVSNILNNAIEYSESDKEIQVVVKKDHESGVLEITVEDFGVGIEEEQQKNIFDRFEQLDKGTTKLHPGHGLGLSIVLAFVQILNGEIKVESKVGQGSKFTIMFQPMDADAADFASSGNEFFFDMDETF